MFLHSVYFWLKDSLTEEQVAEFEAQLQILTQIKPCEFAAYGKPVPSERPVVDSSYTFKLFGAYATSEDHDAYQVHPKHKHFLETYNTFWDKVVVYDADK